MMQGRLPVGSGSITETIPQFDGESVNQWIDQCVVKQITEAVTHRVR
jgi:hypothetical protein